MNPFALAWCWNATPEEQAAVYPCDRFVKGPYREIVRAIDLLAPANVAFRWLCQLKVAPYSYDWIDNKGKRSPRALTPGAEQLAVGQRFLIGRIVAFEENRHITSLVDGDEATVFGFITLTYWVRATGPASSRLVVKIDVGARSAWGRLMRLLIAWGDLIMMRKQLLTLKALAEQTAVTTG